MHDNQNRSILLWLNFTAKLIGPITIHCSVFFSTGYPLRPPCT